MPVEQDPRASRVLAEHGVRLAQLREDAQRDVLEVADRRGADGERHPHALPLAVERLEGDQPGADQTGVVAELRLDDP